MTCRLLRRASCCNCNMRSCCAQGCSPASTSSIKTRAPSSWAISCANRSSVRSPEAMCNSEYAAPSFWEAKSRFLVPLDKSTTSEYLNPNPPKDTDGRREESGRGGEGATGEIAWVPFGVGRSADGLHRRTGAPMAVCGSCDARDGERIRSRELSRTGLARVCGDLRLSGGWVADGAVRPGVEWLAAGPRRG